MGVHRKIVVIISLVACGLLLSVYFVARLILLGSFDRLDRDSAHRDLERIRSLYEDRIDYLEVTTTDWAYWDDTYAFIQDGNEDYIEANLGDSSIVNLNLNMMLFIDNSGQIVFRKAFDLDKAQEVPVPEGLDSHLSPEGLLLVKADASSLRSGILMLPQGPMVIAVRPILTTANEGPSRGTLVFGYYLNAAQITSLARSAHLPLAVRLWNDPQLPDDFRAVRDSLSVQSPLKVRTSNDDTLTGYSLLTDIYGQPALIFHIDFSRQIYAQGQTVLIYFMLTMLGLGVVTSVVLLGLLEKTVLTQAQMGAMLEHSDDIIILTRTDGTIQRVSPAFGQMFAGMTDGYRGRSLFQLFVSEFTAPLKEAFSVTIGKRENQKVDLTVQQESGSRISASMALSPVVNRGGQISGVLCSLRDISAHKSLEQQLRKTIAQEIELNHLKTRLISMASHELRNPLSTIQLVSETLVVYRNRMTDEEKQKQGHRMMSSIEQMTSLLDDLLELTRTESDNLQLEPTRFDLVALCQNIVEKTAASAPNSCTFHLSKEVICSEVCMDQRLVQLIIRNLLAKTVKIVPAGSTIHLDVKCEDDRRVLTIRGADVRMSSEKRAGVFEPSLAARNADSVEETGLGLEIVKQAVELHGGTLIYENEPTVGTVFSVTLPNWAGEQ